MTTNHKLLLACVAVLGLAALVWWLRPQGGAPVAPPPAENATDEPPVEATPQQAEELLRELNVGLAHLENDQLPDAVADLTELSRRVPDELAAQRNLMVAQLLNAAKLDTANPQRAVALADAQSTLRQLQRLDPDSLATQVLSARLAVLQGQPTAAMRDLIRATEIVPDDLPTWYEQFTLGQHSEDEALSGQAAVALDRAAELAPTNLVVLLKLLERQFQAQDPAIVDTLDVGEPRWQQLAPGIQSRVRVDLNEMVAAAREAAAAGDWPTVVRNCRRIINVVTPEEATRSDRRLVERHALEFVVDQLSDSLMQLAEQATPAATPATPTFAPAGDDGPPPISDSVLAVRGADFDLDTTLDVAVLQEGRIDVHRLNDAGWSLLARHEFMPQMTDLLAIDLDDDITNTSAPTGEAEAVDSSGHPVCHSADLDLVLYGPGGVIALQNAATDAGRELQSIELPEQLADMQNVRSILAVDLDMDGDLDLFPLAESELSVWANRGDLTFADDLLSLTGLPDGTTFTAATTFDWDADLDPDIVLADDTGHLSLLENLRHGEFQWRDLNADAAMQVTAIAPLDRDGAWDLLLAGDAGLKRIRASRPTNGQVELSEPESRTSTPMRSLQVADLNNDGPLDLLGLGADGAVTLLGQTDTSLSVADAGDGDLSAIGNSRAFDVVDVDRDGRLDVLGGSTDGLSMLLNSTADAGGWLDVSLIAEQIKGNDLSASGRVNHYGIGSVLELRSGAHRQRQIVDRPTTHFGLGAATQADAVRVLWTNGVPENVVEPAARLFICERQTLKGSCPYLYGWNGEEFAFITDLLWASPLGLIGADGRLVPARPWEYLKIEPQQLVARDGSYELRLTEELWEAAYFDSVRLFAVDHPADCEIVTNEKVGPPAIAEHRLYTVTDRRTPLSAVDQRGRDVLPLLCAADERYVKLFDHKFRQGYTEPTTLELGLGDFDADSRVVLFLRGWIYPTDTTINVALSQNPALDGPQPLSLSVRDADGEWQTVIPYTGFPGGKTKTIAIDLTGKFLTDDHRIRLSTSNELYWDAVSFTVDEPVRDLQEVELPLLRADLQARGVSAPIVHPQFGPERYDYESIRPSPWEPMYGLFTRFGDVRELLAEEDSRLVVMGSGDEVVLEFAAPPPPPDGHVRSFVLRNVGWDKDADLQTIYGQTIEPLPFVTQTGYPWPEGESPRRTPEYEDYLRTMQTRRMRP